MQAIEKYDKKCSILETLISWDSISWFSFKLDSKFAVASHISYYCVMFSWPCRELETLEGFISCTLFQITRNYSKNVNLDAGLIFHASFIKTCLIFMQVCFILAKQKRKES